MHITISILVVVAATSSMIEARPKPNPDLSTLDGEIISTINPVAEVITSAVGASKLRLTSSKATDNATLESIGTSREAQWQCLIDYSDFGWTGNVCDGRGWYMKGRGWETPADCYSACYNSTWLSISNDLAGAECHREVGLAACWMGYHDQNQA